jgi:thiol-disulfide isomerase/thioredoxin
VKYIFSFSLLLIVSLQGFCQADSSAPVYLRFPTVPQFTLYTAPDSSAFSKANLKKNKPLVFMIFSPECEHCQHETEALLANIDKFRNAQIVMVTYLPYEEMVEFYRKYKIHDYPEITMARDTKFFFPVFFKVRNLPSIYVYDRKGDFKKSFEGSVKIDSIAAML